MILKQVVGVVGIVLGLACLATSMVGVGEIVEGVATGVTYGTIFLLVSVGGFSLAGGRRMLVDGANGSAALEAAPADPESLVLALAAAGGGRVTVVEVAAKTALSLDEATETLSAIERRGLAQAIVTDTGVVVYEIQGLLSIGEKAQARDILDA